MNMNLRSHEGMWIALAVLLAGSVLASALSVWIERHPVNSVRVAGTFREVDRGALEEAIAQATVADFFRADVDSVRQAAMALPWVREVSVRRMWPDSLHVAIVERVPVARWGDDALLEADGSLFAPEKNHTDEGLPTLYGPSGSEMQVLIGLKRFQTLLSRVFRGETIVKLTLDSRGGWRIGLSGGTELVLGRDQGIEALRRFVKAIASVSSASQPQPLRDAERVDLRYANGFAIRWRQGSR